MTLGVGAIIFVDLWPGLALLVAGWLLVGSSRLLDRRLFLQGLIAGAHVSDAADSDTARIPPQLTLDVFAGEYLGERLGGAALVERGEELLGLIGTAQIRRIPRRNWPAMRTEQAMATKAQIVATACTYCLQMFQDGIKTKEVEETFKVMDVAELLAESAVYHPHTTEEKK